MMHDCSRWATPYTRQFLIAQADGLKSLFYGGTFERYAPTLTKFLHRLEPCSIQVNNRGKFGIIQHRHVRFAPPAPKNLHANTFEV